MIINNIGFNHCHDSDFFIDRPYGSNDNLLLLLKTDSIFNLDDNEIIVPENSFFIYKKGRPQRYRCIPKNIFCNDWIHFEFENGEEETFFGLGLQYEQPVHMQTLSFLSFCIKSISYEWYSNNINKHSTISHYMFLLFNNVSEQMYRKFSPNVKPDSYYELLSTIRNKIYSNPFEKRNVDSTAHEVRMSKSNFQHLYKKYFGVTFMQDLINSRIEYSKMLLLNTNLNINDIALQSGYNNYVHFTKQFKSKTGVTPLEYKMIFNDNLDI